MSSACMLSAQSKRGLNQNVIEDAGIVDLLLLGQIEREIMPFWWIPVGIKFDIFQCCVLVKGWVDLLNEIDEVG